MPDKPKVAFYWCASCGGCEEAVVDLAEAVLDVVAAVDIVFWPVALDFKRKDVEAMPDGSIVAAFVNGAIRTTEQMEMANLMRRKSKVLIAFGTCAQEGGIPGLGNMADRESILRTAYLEAPSVQNQAGILPKQHVRNGHDLELPGLFNTVRTLDQVVDVDYYLPGCPPTPKLIAAAVQTLLSGQLPEKGSVLAPDKALCDECSRKDSKPEKLSLAELKRPHEVIADETKCLLAQGIVCMGPSTRAGCGAQCVGGNMPCTGCFGPTSRVRDKGAKALAGLASIIEPKEEEAIDAVWAQLPDPIGTFYRYSLPGSLLRRKKLEPAASGPNTPVTR